MFATGQRSWTSAPSFAMSASSAAWTSSLGRPVDGRSNVTCARPEMRVRRLTAGAGSSIGKWAAPRGSRDASNSKSMLKTFVRSMRATKSAVAPSQPISAAKSISTG